MKIAFQAEVLLKTKGLTNLTDEKYDEIIKTIENLDGANKNSQFYRITKKYSINEVNGKKCLVSKDMKKSFLRASEYFDILFKFHQDNNHCGRNKLEAGMRNFNISREIIMIFLSICTICTAKKIPEHLAEHKVADDLNFVGYFDVFEMEDSFIVVFVDKISSFCIINLINDNTVPSIVEFLIQTFCDLGYIPSILYSNIESETLDEIVKEIKKKLDVKIIGEKGGDLSEIVEVIKERVDWKDKIKIIQFNINNTVSNITKKSPFEALFGRPMQVKLKMPEDLIDRQEPDADVEKAGKKKLEVEKAGKKQLCNCKSCNNKRCCCLKSGLLCGEDCHIGTVCKNVK